MTNRRINRRRFLQATAGAAALVVLPRRAYPFAQSIKNIRKFIVTLPGLGPLGANSDLTGSVTLGNYIPVLAADKSFAISGLTVYSVEAGQFTQQVHPDIPATTFWGYGDKANLVNGKIDFKYLGGVIVATAGQSAQLRVTNNLPMAHILPVDLSLVDQAEVPTNGRTDIIAVHLHGGFVFWNSDGGPFQWYSSAPTVPQFVTGPSFASPAGPGAAPAAGTVIFNYNNEQTARNLWYHDHAYSLTRTNVYAGLASEYLITDEDTLGELGLLQSGLVPGMNPPVTLGASYPLGIPLVIQDKTFWDGVSDPNYGNPMAGGPPAGAQKGSLWYPHVYEGGNDPADLPSMTLTDLPAVPPNANRWGATADDGMSPFTDPSQFPTPSTVPEFFSDTILVNGAPYPTVTVPPRRLRFRLLNASNARFYNLQMYVQNNTPDGITYAPTGEVDNNGNVTVAPTNRPGPAFIQIGNEGGFLPAPMVFSTDSTTSSSGSGARNLNSNRIIGYKSTSSPGIMPAAGVPGAHKKADHSIHATVAGQFLALAAAEGDPTIGNVDRYNLLLAPAERADVIIDFRDFVNQKLILYNDAPAPFPGGDIRNDYYVGDPDLTSINGTPPTPAAPAGTSGVGPDTRVLMQFVVGATGGVSELSFADTVADLKTQLAAVFKNAQFALDPNALVNPSVQGKSLGEDTGDGFGRLTQLLGDGSGNFVSLVAEPTDTAVAGEVQRWMIFNTTADTHPMHIHLVNFKVIGRQQWEFNTDGTFAIPLTPIGTLTPPDPNEMGWKETIRINPGEVAIVDMKFDLPVATATNPAPPQSPRLFESFEIPNAGEYVWHCHILEHEEHDMMHALVILPAAAKS